MCYAYRMNIAKGIKGIRAIKATNKSGWHVFIDGGTDFNTYTGYDERSFEVIVRERSWAGNTLIHVTGNALTFETHAVTKANR